MVAPLRVWRDSLVARVKASACDVGGPGSIPGSGRSPGEGNGNPLQYSCLENPMDGEPGRLQSTGSQSLRHDWATSLSLSPSLEKRSLKVSVFLFISSCILLLLPPSLWSCLPTPDTILRKRGVHTVSALVVVKAGMRRLRQSRVFSGHRVGD